MSDLVPVPGNHHPAVVEYAEDLARFSPGEQFLADVRRSVKLADFDNIETTAPVGNRLVFTAQKAAQSFFPDLGAWVWFVWRDQYGRHVTTPARWQVAPAADMYEPLNPLQAKPPEGDTND